MKTLITQIQFDSFFAVGAADAAALNHVNDAISAALAPLSGKIEQKAADTWNAYREAYIEGFCSASAIDLGTVSRRWTRLIESLGFTKPQTPAAAAKQAQRAKHAPSKPVVVKAEKSD